MMNLLLFTLLICAIPLMLFQLMSRRFRERTFYFALLGFTPALFLLARIILG
jgi:hypothetical protein